MPENQDFYQLLGIEPDATVDQIEAAYRAAAVTWHPDLNKSPEATRMMQEINRARNVLLNPMARMLHNLGNPTYREWARRTGRWVPPQTAPGPFSYGPQASTPSEGSRYAPGGTGWSSTPDWVYEPPELEPEDRPYIPNRLAALFVIALSSALIYAFVTEVVLA